MQYIVLCLVYDVPRRLSILAVDEQADAQQGRQAVQDLLNHFVIFEVLRPQLHAISDRSLGGL